MTNLNDRIISLYENDYSVAEIAAVCKVSSEYINTVLDDDAYFNYDDNEEFCYD